MVRSKNIKIKNAPAPDAHQVISNNLEEQLAWWQYLIPAAVLGLCSSLFYYPSLHYSFQFDDIANIQKFFAIRNLSFWQICFNHPRWISAWLNSVNYSLGKFDPFTYRLFNVTFHTITGILVFFFWLYALSKINRSSFFYTNRFALAFTSALLFLLHPVQTQTVSYVIQGQLEGLATLFTMAILLCFLHLIDAKSKSAKVLYGTLLIILAALSTGTKEIAILSPLLALLMDWFFIAQGDVNSLKKRWYYHALLFAVVWGLYLYFLKPTFFTNMFGLQMEARNNIGNVLTEVPGQPIKPLHYCISQFKVLLHYIFMFVWPFSISVEYDWKLVAHFFAPDCILPLLVLLGVALFVIQQLRKEKTSVTAFAILWFFIANAPRTSIVPSSELLADYKTYLASVGILFLLACLLVYCLQSFIEWAKTKIAFNYMMMHYALLVLLVIPFGCMTYQRNKVWRSPEEFWNNIIENAPGKARAYNNLGVALSEQGRMAESIPLYKKAIGMDKNYPDPWNNLAVAYSMTGKLDLAIDTLKQAIKIHQNYPEGYNNLASFLIQKKDYAMAEKMLRVAIYLRPHYGKAYFNLGKNYFEQGQTEQAFEAFKAACTIADLDNASGFTVYANIAMNLQKYDDAIFAYSKLLELQPNSLDCALNLANAYFLGNKPQDAIPWFERIVKAAPQEARAWYNMAECYLRLNKPERALECFNKVEQLKYPVANLPLRMAFTYKLMGKLSEAKKILQACITNAAFPENMKKIAVQELAML